MIVKKIVIPTILVLLALIVLKNTFYFKKNSSQIKKVYIETVVNTETYKTFETQIKEKDILLALVGPKSENNTSTSYSLVATNKNDKIGYSSQTINDDVLDGHENITTEQIENETVVVVNGLSIGAHSSGLRVFKVDPNQKQITPVCVSQEKQTKDDPCFFYADAMTEPFFEDINNDKVEELIEMNRSSKDYQVAVLTAVYKYKDGYFIPLIDKEYENARLYLSKSFVSGNGQPFKLIRNVDNTN